MKEKQYFIKQVVLVALFTIHCSLFTSPVRAQIGTWRNYLSYAEPQQIQVAGNDLFVMASGALYQYNQNDQSIYTYDKVNGMSDVDIKHIRWCKQAKRLVVVYSNSNIDLVETNGNITNISDLYTKTITGDKSVSSVRIDGIYAYLICGFGIVKVNVQRAEIAETYTPSNPDYPTLLPDEDNSDYDKYIDVVKTLQPGGPKYNYFGFMRFKHDRLYTCGGGYSAFDEWKRPGTIQVLNNGSWLELQSNIAEVTGWRYRDVLALDIDPNDPEHIFACGQTGLYEFQNNLLKLAHNIDNSPLESNIDNRKEWVIVEGVVFDNNSNMYCSNVGASTQAILQYTNNKKWNSINPRELFNSDNVSHYGLQSLYIDSRELLWFVNYHWIFPAIFCYDIKNGKLISYFSNFINQDGIALTNPYPHYICEDKEGNMWIGTFAGPLVINKEDIYETDHYLTQIKVPRNDGTDYADYLFSGINITAIAIDGGNRKWFGTNNNGVYLISADNMVQIHHFTTENSPLLSNSIESITINPNTGEVFFGTIKGLCSFISDATEPNDEMTKDNVWAYPNPVEPGYTGPITITGLTLDADVKILSANGALIHQGRSNGGTYTWDGCDQQGRRVASGVYMVATATNSGEKGTVCKIAIVR